MTIYAPEMLRKALEVALEAKLGGKSLVEFYGGGRGRSYSERAITPRQAWSGDHWTPDVLNADRELQRDLDALTHISADCPRDRWRKIVAAIADRHLGSDMGHEIARAWSLGGSFGDFGFRTPSGNYTLNEFEACWLDACRNAHFSIGTVFRLAKEAGWSSSRARWGLGRVQRAGKPRSAEALQVQAAGQLMPRTNPNLERIAWYWQICKATRRPDLRDVGFVIAFSINIGSGFAWRSFEAISKLLGWPRGRKGDGFQRVSRAVRDLALLDFIVRSPGNERGAHGRIGPSFALTLPDAMTWKACIAAYQTDFGARSRDTPELAATSTDQHGSKPKKEAQTHTKNGGSHPSSNGGDQHQDPPVQTTPISDQHEDMPVHLNVEPVGGGREAKTAEVSAAPLRSVDPTSRRQPAGQSCFDGAGSDQTLGSICTDPDLLEIAMTWKPEDFWGAGKQGDAND